MTLLEVRDLVKHFPIGGSRRRVQAVNGISFSIARGETVALVGESGSGKTTVGRCLLGLVPPSSGTILFEGKPVGGAFNVRSPGLRGRMQMVFQEPAECLNPRHRVADILAEPLIYVGMPRAHRDKRVVEVAQQIGLHPAMLDKLPSQLSAGLQQRVGIGRAIITRPDLVVFDEPTSALDPTARAEIVELLQVLQADLGTAYLFISHDLSTVRFLSDRVIVLYLGSIVEDGPAERLFAEPSHPYSLGLLASVLLPHPSLKTETRLALAGEIPSPIDLPPGCPLAGRCPFVEDRCRIAFPPRIAIDGGHDVFCVNHQKVTALGGATDNAARFQEIVARVLDPARA